MKKLTILFLAACIGGSFATAQTAGEYMDNMSKDMKNITQASWDYISATSHGNNAKKVDKKRLDLLQTLSDSKSRVAKIGDYNGNSTYRDAVVKYLDMSYDIFNEDYANLVDMEEVAEQSYDFMEAYMLAKEKANEKLDQAGNDMEEAEKAFAKENNINLIDPEKDKISENIRVSNLVYDHYNVVYLIFFKSYKTEYFLLEAIKANDVNAIEQNRNALIKNSDEGLAKIKTTEAYNKDATLVLACKKMLEFYKAEAEKDIPVIQDFYLKEENFTKVKSAYEAKKEKDITQADVDQYNDAVKTYNEAANALNATSEKLNNDRSKNLDTWNKAVETFLDKQVPKD
jgi:hypothetical protein